MEKETDIFKCMSCPKTSTRGEILNVWTSIPFKNEEEKKYYCGCMGWD